MKQDLHESTDALIQADAKEIEKILNRKPTGQYWIVIAYKPMKAILTTGETVLRRMVKTYVKKPPPLIGTIVLEVCDGQIMNHQINVHDIPIDWKGIGDVGSPDKAYVQNRPDIANSYVYNN
jgi:hypothetical protein